MRRIVDREDYKRHTISVVETSTQRRLLGGSAADVEPQVCINDQDVTSKVIFMNTKMADWIESAKKLVDAAVERESESDS